MEPARYGTVAPALHAMNQPADFTVESGARGQTAGLTGDWTAVDMGWANERLEETLRGTRGIHIDATGIERCDTSGAYGILKAIELAAEPGEITAREEILRLLDMVTEITFGWGISRQHQEDAPVMDNMDRSDNRLPNKTYVWGITIGDDAACWTDDFIVENDWIVNARVGGRDVVVSLDPRYESLGVWYNDSGQPVTRCNFWGVSDQGQLQRVETLRAGVFWHVWSEFFPNTEINRVEGGEDVVGETAA